MPHPLTEVREALHDAMHQFGYYVRSHLAKTPPDEEKAETNRRMANRCAKALATLVRFIEGEAK